MIFKSKTSREYIAYLLPLGLVIGLSIGASSKTVYKSQIPQTVTLSGGSVHFSEKFGPINLPNIIQNNEKPPLAIVGIPKELFTVQFCLENKNYYLVGNKKILTQIDKIDLRVKPNKETTIHIENNQRRCLPFKEGIEYYFGGAESNSDEAKAFMNKYGLNKINGVAEVSLRIEPIYNIWFIFVYLLFIIYPAIWALILLYVKIDEFVSPSEKQSTRNQYIKILNKIR